MNVIMNISERASLSCLIECRHITGGEEVCSSAHTKEDGEDETQRRERKEPGLGGRQTASGSQKTSDGGKASGF